MQDCISELFDSQSKFILIIPTIDENQNQGGGIETGYVTEIYGPSGTGKTHICLAMLANTIVNDPTAKVLYVSTTKQIPIDRLVKILESKLGKKQKKKLDSYLSNCIIEHLDDHKELDLFLNQKLPAFAENYKCPLLIIDNIYDYIQEKGIKMKFGKYLQLKIKIAIHLKQMAQKFDMAIVLVNNAIVNFKNKQITPALSDYWNQLVDERYFIDKQFTKRYFQIENSHKADNLKVPFQITDSGVQPLFE
ncbi:DNA repair protein xrcc3 [Paramecium bursaria]